APISSRSSALRSGGTCPPSTTTSIPSASNRVVTSANSLVASTVYPRARRPATESSRTRWLLPINSTLRRGASVAMSPDTAGDGRPAPTDSAQPETVPYDPFRPTASLWPPRRGAGDDPGVLGALADTIDRHPWRVLIAALLVVAVAAPLGIGVRSHLKPRGFDVPGSGNE